MTNGDTWVVSVTGDSVVARDQFSTSRSTPANDAVNDLEDVTGSEVGGKTIVNFKRKLDTGDAKDKKITDAVVKASMAIGSSDSYFQHSQRWSGLSVQFKPKDSPPGAPTGLKVSAATTTSVTMSWTAPVLAAGVSAVTGYTLQRAPSGSGEFVTAYTGTTTALSAKVSSLTEETAYRWRVLATNGAGNGAYSTEKTASTLSASAAAPEKPAPPQASASSPTSITIALVAPSSTNGSAVVKYVVEVAASGSDSFTAYEVDASESTFEIPGLDAGASYDVKVKAVNLTGASLASTSAALTTVAALTCAGNCSNKGSCVDGNCRCNAVGSASALLL
jgi:hypothetical protein